MSDTAAIVLAAGLSRRMGELNKLLLHVGEDILLAHVISACAAATDHQVTVVTGHQAQAVIDALAPASVNVVHNRQFEEGQMTSVESGLRGAPKAETYLIALGDQPLLTAGDLKELLAAHQAQANGRITVPMVGAIRGNPIVVPAAQRALILADPVNLGCRKLTRTSPERVHQFRTANRSFIADIDTPEDLAVARSYAISKEYNLNAAL